MAKKFVVPFLVFFLITMTLAASSQENQKQVNDKTVLKTTLSYLMGRKNYSEALLYTKKYLKKYPKDAEAWQLEGLVHYAKKDFVKSEINFKKAASLRDPETEDRAIDYYLASQSAIKQGKLNQAQEHLLDLSKMTVASAYANEALAQLAREQTIPELNLSMLQNPPEKKSLESQEDNQKAKAAKAPKAPPMPKNNPTAFVEVVGGIDTNPIFLPDNSQSKNEAESTFYSTTLGLGYATTLKGGEFNHNFTLGYTGYQKEAAKSFNNLRLSLGSSWKPRYEFFVKNNLSLTNKIDQSYGTNQKVEYYYTSETLGLKKEFTPIGDHQFQGTVSVGYKTYANKNLDVKENDRSGTTLGLGANHKLLRGNWIWMNNLSFSHLMTVGKKFNTNEISFITNYQKIIWGQTELFLGANLGQVSYPNNGSRVDRNYGAEVSLARDLRVVRGMNLKASASRSQNKSDIADSNYTQDIFALWVTYELF